MEEFKGLSYQWNKYENRFTIYNKKSKDIVAYMYWYDKPKLWTTTVAGMGLNSPMLKTLSELSDKLDVEARSLSSIAKAIDSLEK